MDSRAVDSCLVVNLLETSAYDAHVGTLIFGHADQCGDILCFALDEPFRAIDRVDPYTQFIIWHDQLLKLSFIRTKVKIKLIILHSYLSLIIDSLFPYDFEFGEVVCESFDDHGLYMVVGLK